MTKEKPETPETKPVASQATPDIKALKSAIEKQLSASPTDVSIIDLVDLLVQYSYNSRASDIHIEPAEKKVLIRLRVDGILQDAFDLSKDFQSEVISRIKVLSGLKTDVHHVPQDGRFKAKMSRTVNEEPKEEPKKKKKKESEEEQKEKEGQKSEEGPEEVDVRVSIAPTYYGENAVMRILAETSRTFTLKDLGFTEEQLELLDEAARKPYGMILANGPTGSGKTTTLYTFIKKLNTRDVSIITIEDPIEYSVSGVTQIPVSVSSGLTFAKGLRSILRQDPNIIMVGEIRDSETANIAVNAALTGHLMLSTLHTNDAATTFPRLLDMGAPPFLVASTVNIVIAQRLVRVACPQCRRERTLNIAELKNLGSIADNLSSDKIYTVGKGCDACDGSGYKSRIGIHEVLEVNDDIRSLIVGRANASQLKRAAIKNGMKTMVEDGLDKAQKGITTIEEILRIVYE